MPKFSQFISDYAKIHESCPQGIAEISLDLDNKTYSYSCVAPTEEAGVTAVSWIVDGRQKTSLIDSIKYVKFIAATLEAIVELKGANRSVPHLAALKFLKRNFSQLFEVENSERIILLSFNMKEKKISHDNCSLSQLKQSKIDSEFLDYHSEVTAQIQTFFQRSPQGKVLMLYFKGYQDAYSELILDFKEQAALIGFIDSLILQDEVFTLLAS